MSSDAVPDERKDYMHELLPVFIDLQNIDISNKQGVHGLIRAELHPIGKDSSDRERIVDSLLRDGKLLILIDGLDKLQAKPKADVEKFLKSLEKFVDNYSQNRFVISCGSTFLRDYPQRLARFTGCRLARFDEDQVGRFIQRWFRKNKPELGKDLLSFLGNVSNAAVKELAQSPLYLTHLCIATESNGHLPLDQPSLYKSIFGQDEQVDRALSRFAIKAFREEKTQFSEEDLDVILNSIVGGQFPREVESGDVFKKKLEQTFVFQANAGKWSFSHLAVQEYFAARACVQEGTWIEDVARHFSEPRWRSIFIFVWAFLSEKQRHSFLRVILDASSGVVKLNRQVDRMFAWIREELLFAGDLRKDISYRAALVVCVRTLKLEHTFVQVFHEAIDSSFRSDRPHAKKMFRALRELNEYLKIVKSRKRDKQRKNKNQVVEFDPQHVHRGPRNREDFLRVVDVLDALTSQLENALMIDSDFARMMDIPLVIGEMIEDVDPVRLYARQLIFNKEMVQLFDHFTVLANEFKRSLAYSIRIAQLFRMSVDVNIVKKKVIARRTVERANALAERHDAALRRMYSCFDSYLNAGVRPLVGLLSGARYFVASWSDSVKVLNELCEKRHHSIVDVLKSCQTINRELCEVLRVPGDFFAMDKNLEVGFERYLLGCRLIFDCRGRSNWEVSSQDVEVCRGILFSLDGHSTQENTSHGL